MSESLAEELQALRDAARRDSKVEAVVLGAVGLVALVGSILTLRNGSLGLSALWYTLATPLAFAGCWLYLRHRRRVVGVGTASQLVGWLAFTLAALAFSMPFAFFIFGPYPVLMGAVLFIGVATRSNLLIGWGLVGGVLGTLAGLFFFGNRSGDLGHWMPWLDDLVGIAVAVVTLVLAVVAAARR